MEIHSDEVEKALDDLGQRDIIGRIWRKDHTVWKPQPEEITDRLGWLSVAEIMSGQVPALSDFAGEVNSSGFRHVVLLGMGGSSLGAEVLRQTFGSADGYPELIVLDSTLPATVQSVADTIDPSRTLFLVSSKSGTTTEPLVLFSYFYELVKASSGSDAGGNFVAITDPGTYLTRLSEEKGFRRAFLNPTDIGGRYSVLSYFGLVPAALIGIDLTILLDRTKHMKETCAPNVPVRDNPGASLGAYMGVLAGKGRDKLTLVTSPAIGSFGLWAEQLLAESTGKEAKGIIPVAGEPLVDSAHYGDDRLFICLRMEGDDNTGMDRWIEETQASGQPVVVLELRDRYDLGAEFYRWEFATAVAGAIMGIHPFNQPNVQQAKDATEEILGEYVSSGRSPQIETGGSLRDLLSKAEKGGYFAIMAYMQQTAGIEQALIQLRRKALERYGITTTSGYGPRFLHSTGQLHKGGPGSGLFLQITTAHRRDLSIPDQPYTFGVVADAQALGDLRALRTLGRDVVTVHLEGDDEAGLQRLVKELEEGS
jgi:glucose-6-phosphate isomerase/transaldolase/glucose-6-phosphate isomerase